MHGKAESDDRTQRTPRQTHYAGSSRGAEVQKTGKGVKKAVRRQWGTSRAEVKRAGKRNVK